MNDWISRLTKSINISDLPDSIKNVRFEKGSSANVILAVTFCGGIATGAVFTLCLSGYLMLPDLEYHFRSFCNDHNLFCAHGTETVTLIENNNSNLVDQKTSSACAQLSPPCPYAVDVPCRVMPYLIDRNQHINNARYIYELNFTRRYSFQRLGITALVSSLGGNMVIQAQTIRYRREMKLWQKYFVRTSIVSWSDRDRCFYVESRFLNEDKTFVLAIHHAKYKIVSRRQQTKPPKRNETDARTLIESETSSRKREIVEDLVPSRILAELGLISDETLTETVNERSFIALWEYANKVSSQELNPSKR
jgi:acyl-CoA thioesterase FadM